MTQQYIDLAERCEAAEAGSRELDGSIWAANEGNDFDVFQQVVPNLNHWQAPHYTTSLDAAMTLLPEGWGTTYVSHPMPKCTWAAVREYEKDKSGKSWTSKTLRQSGEVHAATPALALLAAICRAMGEG